MSDPSPHRVALSLLVVTLAGAVLVLTAGGAGDLRSVALMIFAVAQLVRALR